jgi:hypothetical protein
VSSEISNEARYQEQFTAYIDLLGFTEVSAQTDETTRLKVLQLLSGMASLRSEFSVETTAHADGSKRHRIIPAISSFSEHIGIRDALEPLFSEGRLDEALAPVVVMQQFQRLLSTLAASALRIGLLVRGGATIGKLFHAQGVVFGEALIEAFDIESRIAKYPRVVLSRSITRRANWIKPPFVLRDQDGMYCIDYLMPILFYVASPGDQWARHAKQWFSEISAIIEGSLKRLESEGKLNELAKWIWFARNLREGLGRLPAGAFNDIGLSLETLPQV